MKLLLNNHIVQGHIKRRGDQYVIDPWAMPEGEYEALVVALREDSYTVALSEDGVVAAPKL